MIGSARWHGSPRALSAVITAVIYLSLISDIPTVTRLWSGQSASIGDFAATPIQYARQAVLFLATLVLAIQWLQRSTVKLSRAVLLYVIFIAVEAARALLDSGGLVNVAFGLRVPSLLVIGLAFSVIPPDYRLRCVGWMCRALFPLLLIEAGIAVVQLLWAPPTVGESALGARPWGTFASPDNLGLYALGYLLLLVQGARIAPRVVYPGCVIALLLCVTTGSRTAILGGLLILGGVILGRLRLRLLLIPLAIVALVTTGIVASTPAVSGRAIEGEGRFDIWADAFLQLSSPFEWFFGAGFGAGSNAATVVAGAQAAASNIVDSAFVAVVLSTGLLGMAFFAYGGVQALRAMPSAARWTIAPALLLACSAFNVPDVSPINLLAAAAIGLAIDGASAQVKLQPS